MAEMNPYAGVKRPVEEKVIFLLVEKTLPIMKYYTIIGGENYVEIVVVKKKEL